MAVVLLTRRFPAARPREAKTFSRETQTRRRFRKQNSRCCSRWFAVEIIQCYLFSGGFKYRPEEE